MSRYKSGSVYVIVISIISFIAGLIMFYYGNDRIIILGTKSDRTVKIGKYDLKLYYLSVNEESLENVKNVKFKTDTAEDKSLVTSVRIISPDSTLTLIGADSRIDDKQKRDVYNDLDFFIRNKKPEYKKTFSFTTTSGGIGILLSLISFLTFFSMILSMINKILVEKDRTKFTSSSRLAYALIISATEQDKLFNMLANEKDIQSVAISAVQSSFRELKKKVPKGTVLVECPDNRTAASAINAVREWASSINGDILLFTDIFANLTKEHTSGLLKEHTMSGNLCTMLTTDYAEGMQKYFQISRNTVNKISEVTEVGKSAASENPNKEYLTGIFCLELRFLFNTVNAVADSSSDPKDITGILNYIIKQGNKTGTYNISKKNIQK